MLKRVMSVVGAYKLYERWLRHQIQDGPKLEHIAIILGGTRRWASERNANPWLGHEKGAETVERLLDWCEILNVKSVSLYIFSTENFRRSPKEIETIMGIAEERFRKLLMDERIQRNKVHVKVIGRVELLPQSLQQIISHVEEATAEYDKQFLNLAFAYGGREEIIDAAKKIIDKVMVGELGVDEIDETTFEKYLYTSYMPIQEPDLIIRTSGEEKLSGFLLWQSAYSELCFLDVFWQDFRLIDLLRAIRIFQKRKRRYGN